MAQGSDNCLRNEVNPAEGRLLASCLRAGGYLASADVQYEVGLEADTWKEHVGIALRGSGVSLRY